MKPIIIYQGIDQHDKIIISKEEFEKLITEVYDQGKQDTIPIVCYPLATPNYPEYPTITYLERY